MPTTTLTHDAVEYIASHTHHMWRYELTDGFDPCYERTPMVWVSDEAGGQVDVTELEFDQLPRQWQQTYRDAAVAAAQALATTRSLREAAGRVRVPCAVTGDAVTERRQQRSVVLFVADAMGVEEELTP